MDIISGIDKSYARSLNPQQHDGVHHIDGPLMLLAGAGTGKTRVITGRILHLLTKGVRPRQIAAMTFTNKAAREMKERIGAGFSNNKDKKQIKDLFVGTFHRFCLNILREHFKEAGLREGFVLLSASDQLDILRQAITDVDAGSSLPDNTILYHVSLCKMSLLKAHNLRSGDLPHGISGAKNIEVFVRIYQQYETLLQINNAIDFDDCISKVCWLFEEHKDLQATLRQRYRYILVDEFQDTNGSQFALLKHLVAPEGNICVVGDDDQSIYSWRGAMYETFQKFERYFQNTKLIKLEQNYRCTTAVLDVANSLIQNNPKRQDKTLWSKKQSDFPVELVSHETNIAESHWIAQKCLSCLARQYQASDIAVLYRTNAQSRYIEAALRSASIRYKTYGGQSFFARKEIRDFLAYLRLLTREDDRLAFWRIINTPHRGIGVKTQQLIDSLCQESNHHPLWVLENQKYHLPKAHHEKITKFLDTYFKLKAQYPRDEQEVEDWAKIVINDFELRRSVSESAANSKSEDSKMQNLMSLPAWLRGAYQKFIADNAQGSFLDFIEQMLLSEQEDWAKDKDNKQQTVSLMSIHAAKGLEFPVVFVCGIEDGTIPHKNSLTTPIGIEEERRLLYVAITRAKQRLYLSYSEFKHIGNAKVSAKKSRFLYEIPDAQVSSEQELRHKKPTKEEAIGRLAMIRKSLS
jgi:superfamily I DNA/RNA helicase